VLVNARRGNQNLVKGAEQYTNKISIQRVASISLFEVGDLVAKPQPLEARVETIDW